MLHSDLAEDVLMCQERLNALKSLEDKQSCPHAVPVTSQDGGVGVRLLLVGVLQA
jgi:hypothetical protein